MALVPSIIQAGLHSAIPAAATSNNGYLYYETDTQKLFRSNGSAWVQVAAGTGQAYDASAIDGTGTFKLSGDISPAQITSNQNDYNPTGLSTATVLRLSTDASRNITGLQGGADGRIIVIVNVGSFAIVLKDDDGATSTAGNRFALSGDITLAADDGVIVQYDSTSSRWRCIGKSPGGAGGGGSFTSIKSVWSPDATPASPSGTDSEFDAGSGGVPSGWTEFDQTTTLTVDESSTYKMLIMTLANTTAVAGIYKAIPAGDFTITTYVSLLAPRVNFADVGLALWEDATNSAGDIQTYLIRAENTDPTHLNQYRWNSYNSFNSSVLSLGFGNMVGAYLRIRRTSTTYSFDFSNDGLGWVRHSTNSLGFTPTHFGLVVQNGATGVTIRGVAKFFRYVASDVGITGILNGRLISLGS